MHEKLKQQKLTLFVYIFDRNGGFFVGFSFFVKKVDFRNNIFQRTVIIDVIIYPKNSIRPSINVIDQIRPPALETRLKQFIISMKTTSTV